MSGRRIRSGPAPLPTKLKAITGGKLSDRQKAAGGGVEMSPEIPDPPDIVRDDEAALEHWEYLTTVLEPYGILALADMGLLAMGCKAWARWHRAEAEVMEHGYSNEHGQAHPAMTMLERSQNFYYKVAAEFGLSASSRTRVKATPKPKRSVWEDV